MSDFVGTFVAVFLGVALGEIAKEAYRRYVEKHTNKVFDGIDKTKELFKKERKNI